MSRHSKERDDYPGTGGEFARHILDRLNLEAVKVEVTDRGDHYDPMDKAVRLSRDNHDKRSLTAVAVAAHEVGHAIQDRDGYKPFKSRMALAKTERVMVMGMQGMALLPIGFALFQGSPRFALFSLVFMVLTALISFIFRLMTLRVEYDASFARALPILENGYLPPEDIPAARHVLKAAALTYLSGALLAVLRLIFMRR
jgi:Zn-dependent membrane protease YugP